jgi:hypothetical protein
VGDDADEVAFGHGGGVAFGHGGIAIIQSDGDNVTIAQEGGPGQRSSAPGVQPRPPTRQSAITTGEQV